MTAKVTPMMQQYMKIRSEYPNALLMYRMGDFYEFFFEDANIAARELEIVLTSRSRDSSGEPIPMCGVPWHSANAYIAKLVQKGYHVAVCEQIEDPKQSNGIVKREVTRLLTPGTVIEDYLLDENINNYLAAVYGEGERIGWAWLDVSTGAFYLSEFHGEERQILLEREIHRIMPVECLINPEYHENTLWERDSTIHLVTPEHIPGLDEAITALQRQFKVETLGDWFPSDCTVGIIAAAIIILYLHQTQKNEFSHICDIQLVQQHYYMDLDDFTRQNLELTSSLRGNPKEGTLLSVLDRCCNPMGKRRLRQWLHRPLTEVEAVEYRLDAVEELVELQTLRQQLYQDLKQLYDIERITGRLGSRSASPRDLLALKNSLALLPQILQNLNGCRANMLQDIAGMNPLSKLCALIEQAIDENAPLNINEGGIIRSGFDPEVDELRALSREGSQWLLEYEAEQREATGIKSLKVSFNRVFGFYIEVTKANLSLVPENYVRKQTLVNNERFITAELKTYEDKILRAEEQLKGLESRLFMELRDQLEPYCPELLQNARLLAELDCILSLAVCAYLNDYCRPRFKADGGINIIAGRHPVIELSLSDNRFVPNDLELSMDHHRFAIITGPNMGGKSTFMRQVALICLMAQMGSFVPAEQAELSILDRIFTRVGASDNLYGGQSTFMVEMVELAEIMKSATENSLIILDEIGRGTSTYDGLSIAQATSEYIETHLQAKTLFATHYHELTALAEQHEHIFNLSVSVIESGDTLSFMKKVLYGKADKSYGIHVAQLAGLPLSVTKRANEILAELETEPHPAASAPSASLSQGALFIEEEHPLIDSLRRLNLDGLTPREALSLLYQWKEQV